MRTLLAYSAIPHQYPVALTSVEAKGNVVYEVRYGVGHTRQYPDFTTAANEFNDCLLHAASCAGLIDDGERYAERDE